VQFNPGTDFDHLAAGATAGRRVTYTMQDEHGATSTSTLTVTVTGTNDAPVAMPTPRDRREPGDLHRRARQRHRRRRRRGAEPGLGRLGPFRPGQCLVVGNNVQFDPGTDFDHLAAGATHGGDASPTRCRTSMAPRPARR
jgi:hypothetical protein